MASTSTSTPTAAPKAMSSRLLTMKFMQRAAASPTSPSPSTPEEPPNKRRKKDSDSAPPVFDVNALANNKAVQRALAEEEAIREAALERAATEAGDTRWVLSFEDEKRAYGTPPVSLRVVQTGFANLDNLSPLQPLQTRSLEEGDLQDKPMVVGRRSFGKFNRVAEQHDHSAEDTFESDGEDDEDSKTNSSESDSDSPTNALIKASRKEAVQRARAERKNKKKDNRKNGDELARQQRKKKDVNLNGLTSLSGDKNFSPAARGPCYRCGGPHMKADCPQSKRLHPGGNDGRPRKTFRTR